MSQNLHTVSRRPDQSNEIQLRFRVSQQYINAVTDLVQYKFPNSKHKENKKVNTLIHDRLDAVGNKKFDTGLEMFAVGKRGNTLTFTNLLDDMQNAGYALTKVYLVQKKKDIMRFIVFCFDNRNTHDICDFPAEVCSLLKRLTDLAWQHTHIWNNPDGSITINAAHILPKYLECSGLRFKHSNEEGQLHLIIS